MLLASCLNWGGVNPRVQGQGLCSAWSCKAVLCTKSGPMGRERAASSASCLRCFSQAGAAGPVGTCLRADELEGDETAVETPAGMDITAEVGSGEGSSGIPEKGWKGCPWPHKCV